MDIEKLSYFAKSIADMAGVPVRIVDKKGTIAFFSNVFLKKDPYILFSDEIQKQAKDAGIYFTKDFYYFAFLRLAEGIVVIGPARHYPESLSELRRKGFLLGLEKEDADVFASSMKSIVSMPAETLLQILLMVDYALTGRKRSLKDILVSEDREKLSATRIPEGPPIENPLPHNTFLVEKTLVRIVKEGDVAAFRSLVETLPPIRPGFLSEDYLRQNQNTFIVTATLVSRAAVEGGLDINVSLQLSDLYIQKAERTKDPSSILSLQVQMIQDYVSRVHALSLDGRATKLTAEVSRYLEDHLGEEVSVKTIAKALFMSESTLSHRFRKERGIPLKTFLQERKTKEAKRLLKETDRSLMEISTYLGFRSQSHFSKSFRAQTGMSPKAYRDKARIQEGKKEEGRR